MKKSYEIDMKTRLHSLILIQMKQNGHTIFVL